MVSAGKGRWSQSCGIERGDRGRDDRLFFVPHATVFTRVGVEPATARRGAAIPKRDAELLPQWRARADEFGQQSGTLASATWTVIGMTRGWVRKHHHRLGRADPAGFGHEFGLAGKIEADFGETALGDRGRDESRRRTAAHEPGCHFETAQGERRSGCIGLAGGIVAFADVEHGQGLVKGLERLRL
jgi:hypothetical protein